MDNNEWAVNKRSKDVASRVAYKSTTQAIQRSQSFKDPSGVGSFLAESLVHERAYSLDHFATEDDKEKEKTYKLTTKEATDEMMKKANSLTRRIKVTENV